MSAVLSSLSTVAPSSIPTAGSGSTTITAPAPHKAKKMDVDTFILHINLILFCFFALFVLWRSVGVVARFTQSYHWGTGLILRSSTRKSNSATLSTTNVSRPRPDVFQAAAANQSWFRSATDVGHATPGNGHSYNSDDEKWAGSDESHTYVSHHVGAQNDKSQFHQRSATGPSYANYPPHVLSSLFRFLYPFVTVLRTRVDEGVTLGEVLILALYSLLVLYAAFYKSNPFTDPVRAGWVAISQIPVVVTLGTKNNIAGMLLAVGYEKLNFIHRFAGRAVFFAVNVHGLGYMYKWLVLGTFSENFFKPANTYGFVTLIGVDILAFFSISFFRRKFHGFFMTTHLVGLATVFVGAYMHKTAMRPYILAAIGLYALDRLIRIIKTRITTATLHHLPGLNTTRISIPSLNEGWRAGQHVRIKVLSTALGMSCAQSHPFTIASVSDGESESGDGVVLMVKAAGDWTRSLLSLSKSHSVTSYSNGGASQGRPVRVLIEGPYGGPPAPTIFASFNTALLVAGGSGISFALSSAWDLVQRGREGRSSVKSVELVWIVQDGEGAVRDMIGELDALVKRTDSRGPDVRLWVHYTRASSSVSGSAKAKGGSVDVETFYHPSIALVPGRPNVKALLDASVNRSLSQHPPPTGERRGMVVGVCGPKALADSVVGAVDGMDWESRKRVGGVEVVEEFFSL